MVQTSPPATTGGPPPTEALQQQAEPGGELRTPGRRSGRSGRAGRRSSPRRRRHRRCRLPQASASVACSPPMPPRLGPVRAGRRCGPCRPPPPGRREQQRPRRRQVEVARVLGGPRRRREVLHQREGGRELEHRVTVVVGVAGRGHRAVAGRDPDVAAGVHHRGRAAHPDGTLALAGARVDRRTSAGVPPGLGHRHAPTRGTSSSPRSSRRSRRRRGRHRASARCAGGARPGWSPTGRRSGSARPSPWPCRARPAGGPGLPLTSSSATTKTSPRASSITGVPVMPTVGEMSPQGSDR